MATKHGSFARIGARALAALFALVLAILTAEALVRATDPFGISYYGETSRYFGEAVELPPEAARSDGMLFRNLPGVELELRGFRFVTNRLGLRSDRTDDGVAADSEAFRILFLGDSVTLAWGVDDPASWIRTLEREARAVDGRPLECLNAGHLYYNTIEEADWFHALGVHLSPDAVVLTFVVNDLDDNWEMYTRYRDALAARGDGGPTLRERLIAWFRGLHGLWVFHLERRRARGVGEPVIGNVEEAPGYAEGWPRAEAALERIRATCVERGIPLVILDHTTPRIADVRRWCERRGVPWFDLTFTEEEWALDVRNSAADSHANELGNRLLADKALAALGEVGILAPGAAEGGR